MCRKLALRVLFLVEGFTDIRFVVGLSEVCDLTMVVPQAIYGPSGLRDRVVASGAKVRTEELPGGRVLFALRALRYCLIHAGRFDVILAQEVGRGGLAANLGGLARGVPVVNTMGIAHEEYFRCRWDRCQLPYWKYLLGRAVIRALLAVNGRLAATWLTLGPYLRRVARAHCPRTGDWYYYGVDSVIFRPATAAERADLRRRFSLPEDGFLVLLSSRVSHEKDPETVLRAVALARAAGVNASLLNLSGGHEAFMALARSLNLPDVDGWVIGRPAVHPMGELADYYRAADVLAQASLAEGLGLSPLEALACGVPVVATAVGGMAAILPGRARLTPPRAPAAMAEQLIWVASQPEAARAQALRARDEYVIPVWGRTAAFAALKRQLERAAE